MEVLGQSKGGWPGFNFWLGQVHLVQGKRVSGSLCSLTLTQPGGYTMGKGAVAFSQPELGAVFICCHLLLAALVELQPASSSCQRLASQPSPAQPSP